MSIRTLLVDDEPLARRNLRALLKGHAGFEIVAECASGQEALAVLKANPIDLMFLDVQMPEMTGFQVLEKLDSAQLPFTIFVTAFDEYAIKAFEVNAADYLLKPVDDKRFEKSLSRAKALIDKGCDGLDQRITQLLDARDRFRVCPAKTGRPLAWRTSICRDSRDTRREIRGALFRP